MGVPPQPVFGINGLSWFGVLHTSSFPPLCTQSQAQPLPNRVCPCGVANFSLKASKEPKVGVDGRGQVTFGFSASVRGHDGPEQAVVVVATTVVADGHVVHVQTFHQVLDGLTGVRRAFESLVQVGHVGIVVLAMVDLHGQRVDMGLQRIVCVGQFW
jgi:hypothetical protein